MPQPYLLLTPLLVLAAVVLPVGSGETPAAAPVESSAASTEATPRHPRVIWTDDPARAATLTWVTDRATSDNHALVGIEGAEPSRHVSDRDEELTPHESEVGEVPRTWVHHVRLSGLQPGTAYHVRLVSDGVSSDAFWFRTASTGDEPYAVVYGGDARTGWEDRLRVNGLIGELATGSPELLAFLHGGDYIYDGRKLAQWRKWMEHHDELTTPDGRLLPIVPVRGNHDTGPIYDQLWDTPGGEGRNWFATSLPLGLELVTLDTNVAHGGEQLDWLRAELADRRPQARWLLAQYHRPAFPAVKSAGSARWSWVPSFEEFDVDLVFESDGHVYKRTIPIRDESHDPTGVVYLGEGCLGVPQRTPRTKRWYLQEPGLAMRAHHVTVLSVSADELAIQSHGFPVDADDGRLAEGEHEAVVIDEARFTRRAGYPVPTEPEGASE